MNDRALATSGVPRPGTAVIPRTVAQAASFSIILSLSFCHLLNDLMQSLVPALYPILKSSYGLSFGQIGVITLTQQCIASMLQPVVGLYTDRRPQPYSLTIGVGFTLVGLLAMSRATSYPAILLAAALIGVGSAVFHPEASRVARMAAGGRYGLAQSLFQVGGNVGSASGPLLAAFVVVPRGQSSIAWFGLAALMAIAVLVQVGAWYARQRAPRRPGVTPPVALPPGRPAVDERPRLSGRVQGDVQESVAGQTGGTRVISIRLVVAFLLALTWGAAPVWAQTGSTATVPMGNYFGGNAGPTTFTPPMFGDLIGGGEFQFGQFQFGGGGCGSGCGSQFGGQQFGQFGQFRGFGAIPVMRGGFKIAENESPRPLDRLYVNYNFYSNVSSVADVHRETLGFEKTLFGGRASVGLRLPFFQVRGDQVAEETNSVGDLTLVLKYAWLNEAETTLSTGLAVTMPSGSEPYAFIVRNGRIEELHPAQFQPFLGYLWRRGDLYVHGFGSIMVPTDSRDVTTAFVDLGIGYWVFRGGGLLQGIVPTFEAHVNIPVNHRRPDDAPRFRDSVDLVAGVHFVLRDRLSIGMAVGVPVTGPRLFDAEAIANINFRF